MAANLDRASSLSSYSTLPGRRSCASQNFSFQKIFEKLFGGEKTGKSESSGGDWESLCVQFMNTPSQTD